MANIHYLLTVDEATGIIARVQRVGTNGELSDVPVPRSTSPAPGVVLNIFVGGGPAGGVTAAPPGPALFPSPGMAWPSPGGDMGPRPSPGTDMGPRPSPGGTDMGPRPSPGAGDLSRPSPGGTEDVSRPSPGGEGLMAAAVAMGPRPSPGGTDMGPRPSPGAMGPRPSPGTSSDES